LSGLRLCRMLHSEGVVFQGVDAMSLSSISALGAWCPEYVSNIRGSFETWKCASWTLQRSCHGSDGIEQFNCFQADHSFEVTLFLAKATTPTCRKAEVASCYRYRRRQWHAQRLPSHLLDHQDHSCRGNHVVPKTSQPGSCKFLTTSNANMQYHRVRST